MDTWTGADKRDMDRGRQMVMEKTERGHKHAVADGGRADRGTSMGADRGKWIGLDRKTWTGADSET